MLSTQICKWKKYEKPDKNLWGAVRRLSNFNEVKKYETPKELSSPNPGLVIYFLRPLFVTTSRRNKN